ncbi:hypothetical protein [Arthrobacter echini]|nr:hypothetical protein [Arthrobacter echini]
MQQLTYQRHTIDQRKYERGTDYSGAHTYTAANADAANRDRSAAYRK